MYYENYVRINKCMTIKMKLMYKIQCKPKLVSSTLAFLRFSIGSLLPLYRNTS